MNRNHNQENNLNYIIITKEYSKKKSKLYIPHFPILIFMNKNLKKSSQNRQNIYFACSQIYRQTIKC